LGPTLLGIGQILGASISVLTGVVPRRPRSRNSINLTKQMTGRDTILKPECAEPAL
jgi:hypothetical protein